MIFLLCVSLLVVNLNAIASSSSKVLEDATLSNILKWKYSAVNPNCTSASGGRNPCRDVRICDFAVVSLMLGGWPTLCGWVGKGVPKVCCGLPLVLGGGLMAKVEAEKSRKRECGRRTMSGRLSETENKFFDLLNTLPPFDASNPESFDPPLDLSTERSLLPPPKMTSQQGYFPWIVAIYKGLSFLCSGALIDRIHILAAAHCFRGMQIDPSLYSVSIGNIDVDGGFSFHVAFIKIHENYVHNQHDNDIAILTLPEEILTPSVPHLCLPDEEIVNMNFVGKGTTAVEWEKNKFGQPNVPSLHISDNIPVISYGECQSALSERTGTSVTSGANDKFICVAKEASTCQFDSGGLLMYKNNYQNLNDFHPDVPWVLVGIATHGCSDSGTPSVYTRVSSFVDWIAKNCASSTTS